MMSKLMTWFVYMVCCEDGSLYTGCTNDLVKRIRTHSLGKGAAYTKSRLPIVLVYYECVENKSAALKREYSIKQLTHAQKLQLLDKTDKDKKNL